jgi:hypothetical protein
MGDRARAKYHQAFAVLSAATFSPLQEHPTMTPFSMRLLSRAASAAVALMLVGGSALAAESASLLEPVDGATVSSPFKVRFGVEGMRVAPAGEIMANSGHHHLLINLDALPKGEVVPSTDRSLHFGKGQTETDVTLPPGRYKLTTQFANGAHQSYGPAMSQTIAITVK